MQNTIGANKNGLKGFILNEESVIKNYGSISIINGKFYLDNNKFNKGNKVAEINFSKTLFKKG